MVGIAYVTSQMPLKRFFKRPEIELPKNVRLRKTSLQRRCGMLGLRIYDTRFYVTNTGLMIAVIEPTPWTRLRTKIAVCKRKHRRRLASSDWLNSFSVRLSEAAIDKIETVLKDGTAVTVQNFLFRPHRKQVGLIEVYNENSLFLTDDEFQVIVDLTRVELRT